MMLPTVTLTADVTLCHFRKMSPTVLGLPYYFIILSISYRCIALAIIQGTNFII